MKESKIIWRPQKYAVKPGINRSNGECEQLLNTTPMRVTGSEYTRYGYSAPTMPTQPTSVTADYYRYASTENPSAKEVLFMFGHNGATKYDYCYSWIKPGTSTWADEWVLMNEQSLAVTIGGVSGATDTTFTATTGVSAVADYHNLWIAVHATKGTVLITDYSWTPSTGTFTTLQNIGSDGLNWVNGETVDLYRWNHSNPTFTPNFDLPHVNTREGIFRVNGGKGSTAGNRGLWMGYINRTFFTGETQAFTYQGTYVAERQLKATDAPTPGATGWLFGGVATPVGYTALDSNKTHWAAVGCIYDGYQHGPIREYGTGLWQDPAVPAVVNIQQILAGFDINKRVTHFVFYIAEDNGDTTTTGRVNDYYEVLRLPLTGADFEPTKWVYHAATGKMKFNDGSTYFYVGADQWGARGNTHFQNSGFTSGVDTMYSFDLEVASANRQWAARIYDYTLAKDDLDRIYTNPRQNGIIAPDVFALEPDIFVGRVLWGDSSYITGLIPSDRGRMIVLKDRAVVDMGVDENEDGTILFRPNPISTTAGCASVNGYVNTPFGIFFAGYDDIWKFTGTLEALTVRDWEDTYRAISTANKQACIAWFRPEDNSLTFQFGAVTSTFTYFLSTQDWRQTQYAHLMASYTAKRDGSIYWVSSGGTAYLFDTTANDAGTAIPTKFKTGYMRCAPAGVACIYREGYLNKQVVASTGTLDVNLKLSYEGTATTKTYSGASKSSRRLWMPLGIDDSAVFDLLSLEYNVNASPETGAVEFGDFEIFLFEQPKRNFA